MRISRRQALLTAAGGIGSLLGAVRPEGYLVENTTHMFSDDLTRFPYHPQGTYKPPPLTVETYSQFVRAAKVDHAVIVQSEVYQDDHTYLEYCFAHEPSPGFFKGTCLFDPIDPKTPSRIDDLVKKHPKRIVGIRIHELRRPGVAPTTTGPFRDRDMKSENMKGTWRKMHSLGLLVQMQMTPHHARQVGELAAEFPNMPVLIDHLAFPARGIAAEYEEVINLSKLPRVFMKVSSLTEKDKPTVKRLYDAYGPDRMIWGSYGNTQARFEATLALIDNIFDYAPEADRVKIRGLNAMKLFGFPLRG